MSSKDKKDLATGFFSIPELYGGKSIQPSYKFLAYFLPNNENKTENMPDIKYWHIQNITIPNYKFKIDKVMYGQMPRFFPTIDMENGMVIKIGMEEDSLGTIAYFVNWCQRCIIDKEGYYVGPLNNRIGHFVVEVLNNVGNVVLYYIFKNLIFQDTSDPTYDYNSTEVIKYDITFVCEIIETWFYNNGKINKTNIVNKNNSTNDTKSILNNKNNFSTDMVYKQSDIRLS